MSSLFRSFNRFQCLRKVTPEYKCGISDGSIKVFFATNNAGLNENVKLFNAKEEHSNAEKLLEDSVVGEGPCDAVDPDDEWRTSPYPVGSALNWKQSQARKSLRPTVDPKETSIILFPGQGSQHVGMGYDLLKYPRARDIFDAANEILKYDLQKIMFNGPKKVLDKTVHAQPAVFVCSLAAIERLKEEAPNAIESCMATAGFSIGELTALTFAGVFTFDTALRLVKVRAQAMQLASELAAGGMVTVRYNHESKLKLACLKAKEWCVERGIEDPECRIANYISPDMKVIAGHTEALKYIDLNKELYKLDSVDKIPGQLASHSNLMIPAVRDFREALKKIVLMDPIISVHSNVDGQYYSSTSHIYRQLPRQIFKPVKWEQTLHILYERNQGVDFPYTYICGPKSPLKNYIELALQYIERNLSEFKIKRFIKLPVSGAFHTKLMKPAVQPFKEALRLSPFSEPSTFVYSNITGKRYFDAQHIIRDLPKQICMPVRWEQIIHSLYSRNIDDFPLTYTCGAGPTLKGILRAINVKASPFCSIVNW